MNKKEYLLNLLSEEANEISLAVSKALRFGLDDDFLDKSPHQTIIDEFNDLVGVIDLLIEEGIFEDKEFLDIKKIEEKKKKVKKYMKYSIDKGLLQEEVK